MSWQPRPCSRLFPSPSRPSPSKLTAILPSTFHLPSGLASSVLCLVQRLFGESRESYATHNAAEFGWDKGALITSVFQSLLTLPDAKDASVHPVCQAIAEDTEFSRVAFEEALETLVER